MSDLLDKAREFTAIEDQTLDVWLRAEQAGLDDLAAQVLDTGLMEEHYRSLLPAKRIDWTSEQVAEYAALVTANDAKVAEVNAALAALNQERQDETPLKGKGQGGGEAGSGKGGY